MPERSIDLLKSQMYWYKYKTLRFARDVCASPVALTKHY